MSDWELSRPHYIHNIDSLQGLLERENCNPSYGLALWKTPSGDFFCQMQNCERTFISEIKLLEHQNFDHSPA